MTSLGDYSQGLNQLAGTPLYFFLPFFNSFFRASLASNSALFFFSPASFSSRSA